MKPIHELSSPAGPYIISAERLDTLFWERVDKLPNGGCWNWNGSRYANGYGRMSYQKRYFYTHRVAYELVKGPVPDGLHTDHLCRNRACCNPDHLEAVTCAENIRRSPIAVAAINAAKTHCIRGHEFTPENTRVDGRGQRACRTCIRESDRAKYAAKKRLPKERVPSLSCRKGHPFDEANTMLLKGGGRRCRDCSREQTRTSRARRATQKVAAQ